MKLGSYAADSGNGYRSICDYVGLRGVTERNLVAYTFLHDPDDKSSYQRITYGELLDRVISFSARLQQVAAPGERAILLYPPGIDYIVAFYSCLWAGLAAVPAYPVKNNQHRDRLRAVIADCTASIILTQAVDLTKLQETRSSSFPTLGEHQIISEAVCAEPGQLALRLQHPVATELAFLQYTSGSTGDPKGVMVTHSNLIHNLGEIRDKFGSTRETVMVSWLPPYHDMGLISAILEPLFVGFHAVLMSPFSFIQRPMRWLNAISEYKATLSGGPNFAFDLVAKARDPVPQTLSLNTLRIMYSGAEPIQVATLKRFCESFSAAGFVPEMLYPCYGLAEGTLFSSGGDATSAPVLLNTISKQMMQWDGATASETLAPLPDQRIKVGCGRTLAQQEIRIVDPDGLQELEDGEEGEIWVSGPSIAKGYWQRDAQTREVFGAYTESGAGPFLRTGDLGFLVNEELFVTGRIKDTIIVRGKKYYPQDIERAVEAAIAEVRPSCTVAFNVGDEGEIAVVAEIERTARKSDPDALLADIRKAVGKQSQLFPFTVVIVAPGRTLKTSSGKVQRRLTRKLLERQEMEVWAQWTRPSGQDTHTQQSGSLATAVES
ncbi:fatty acyl-AMP ligase [Variovorax gossypii]